VNPKSVKRMQNLTISTFSMLDIMAKQQNGNLLWPTEPNQLWKPKMTDTPMQKMITYLMCIKNSFMKEYQRYNYSRSCLPRDVLMYVEDIVLRSFDGEAPEGAILLMGNGIQYNSQHFRNSNETPKHSV
jgi:hypothetical protein